MSFSFVIPEFNIGGAGTPPLQFFRRGFNLYSGGSGPEWRDIILHGNTALTLVNSKANGLNYLKLFGGTEQLPETYLDTVTLSGGCEQSSTPTPTQPLPIVCNNGAIKYSKNLLDMDSTNIVLGYYISNSGNVSQSAPNFYNSKYIPVVGGETYVWSASESLMYLSIMEYNSSQTFIKRTLFGSSQTPAGTSDILTLDSTTAYVLIGSNMFAGPDAITLDDIFAVNWQFELGSTVTPYMPYGQIYTDGTVEQVTDSLGNTASAEILLAVGDYKDTQEVLSGSITRNIGIYILTGEENWIKSGTYTGSFYTDITLGKLNSYTQILCTHGFATPNTTEYASASIGAIYCLSSTRFNYKYDDGTATVEQFQQWLVSQYNAGTPVILVYPLLTATTETVTPQLLLKSPVTQTAGSISNLSIAITESSHTTPTPQQPLQINCNNGVLKVSPNLFNKNSYTEINAYVNSNTGILTQGSQDARTQYCAVIPCLPNTTYTISGRSNSAWGAFTSSDIGTTATSYSKTENGSITTGENDKYLIGLVRANQDTIDYSNTLQIEQGSTATTYRPYGQIYVDGTTETVEVTGKNLFNPSSTWNVNASIYRYVDPISLSFPYSIGGNRYTYFFKCKPSTKYTISTTTAGDRLFIGSSTSIINPLDYTTSNPFTFDSVIYTVSENIPLTYTFETGVNDKMIGIYYALNTIPQNLMIEEWETATTYEQYYNGGQATAEMLLKVGNYQDIQSVLDGEVTHKVGIKVLNGTEDWTYSNSRFRLRISDYLVGSSIMAIIISHYKLPEINVGSIANGEARFGKPSSTDTVSSDNILIVHDDNYTDVNSYKAWLASQYANGTPVIVLYPLATATTETVESQALTIQEGTNIVEITQASMDNLGLEVSYKGKGE